MNIANEPKLPDLRQRSLLATAEYCACAFGKTYMFTLIVPVGEEQKYESADRVYAYLKETVDKFLQMIVPAAGSMGVQSDGYMETEQMQRLFINVIDQDMRGLNMFTYGTTIRDGSGGGYGLMETVIGAGHEANT